MNIALKSYRQGAVLRLRRMRERAEQAIATYEIRHPAQTPRLRRPAAASRRSLAREFGDLKALIAASPTRGARRQRRRDTAI
jgi:hypothetical protein